MNGSRLGTEREQPPRIQYNYRRYGQKRVWRSATGVDQFIIALYADTLTVDTMAQSARWCGAEFVAHVETEKGFGCRNHGGRWDPRLE